MALTMCRECGKQVSTEAPTCPHCGVANPGLRPERTARSPEQIRAAQHKAVGCLLISVLGIGLLAYACAQGDETAPSSSSPSMSLVGNGPFKQLPGYLVCIDKEGFHKAVSLESSGDKQAFAQFLSDQRRNGCSLTKGGVRVYAEPDDIGMRKIRVVGSTDEAYVPMEALVP